jgi:hypothetical protein
MTPRVATAAFAAALVVGAALRVTVLRVGVLAVDDSWRAWSYHAATTGTAYMYGPRGHTVQFGKIDAPVVYPPLALDELGIVGRIYARLRGGQFPDDAGLTMAIKGTIVLFDAVLTTVLYRTLRRLAGSREAQFGAAMYWINPAVLYATSLGYVDALVALPASAAVIAATGGHSAAAGALVAAAAMTKPQGVFIVPVVALALWNAGTRLEAPARERTALFAAAAIGIVLVAPLVAAGTLWYMLRSVAVLAGHNMLSALAFNLWWIVSYVVAATSAIGGGLRAALAAEPAVLTHAYAMGRGLPHPRLIALALLVPVVCWAVYRARAAADLGLHAALAAFIVVAYFVLSVQVHENHFFLAMPFLTLAAALRPAFTRVAGALSITFALNLALTYGWAGQLPSTTRLPIVGIDATVIVALANCALLAWFAAVFARVCRDGSGAAIE